MKRELVQVRTREARRRLVAAVCSLVGREYGVEIPAISYPAGCGAEMAAMLELEALAEAFERAAGIDGAGAGGKRARGKK